MAGRNYRVNEGIRDMLSFSDFDDDLGPDGSTGFVGDWRSVNDTAQSLFRDIKNGGEKALRATAVLINTDLYRKKIDLNTIKDIVFKECMNAAGEYWRG